MHDTIPVQITGMESEITDHSKMLMDREIRMVREIANYYQYDRWLQEVLVLW